MKVEMDTINPTESVLKVTLDWEEVSKFYEKTFKSLHSDLKLDGFRPGRVPKQLAKKVLEPQIKYEFSNEVIRDTIGKALKDKQIDDYIDLDIKELDYREGNSFEYTLNIEFDPQIELFDYKKGFSVEKATYIVDEEDVNLYLEDLREQHAEVREVTDGAKEGEFILCDLQEIDENRTPIIGRKVEDRLIKVGEGIFGGSGAIRLLGAKAGDRVVIETDDNSNKLRFYEVNVKRVESHDLPELTDDFIEANFENVKNYDELRQGVKETLQADWDRRSKEEFFRAIADYFIREIDIPIPRARLNRYLDTLVKDIKLQEKGDSIDESEVKEAYKASAIWEIKWYLIKREIIKSENISISDDEIERKINEILLKYPEVERKRVENFYKHKDNRERLKQDMYEDKIFNYLKQFVEVKDKTIHTNTMGRRISI